MRDDVNSRDVYINEERATAKQPKGRRNAPEKGRQKLLTSRGPSPVRSTEKEEEKKDYYLSHCRRLKI